MKKRSLRIALVTDSWYPVWGGGPAHVLELAKKLVKNHNCEVNIFTRALKDEKGKAYTKNEVIIPGKLHLIRVGSATKFFNPVGRIISLITLAIKILREHQKNNYDIVHTHSPAATVSAKLVQFFTKVKVVHTVHGSNSMDSGRGNFFQKLEKYLLTYVKYDKEITVGAGFLKYKNVNKAVVIANGINLNDFKKPSSKESSPLKILFVGRFDWTKNLPRIINAAKIVSQTNKFKIKLVGFGYDKKKLVSQVNDLDLNSIISFHDGKNRKQVVQEYKNADLFLLPSLVEGQPITLLEAWASKLPVITSDIEAFDGFVVNEKNGWACKAKDTKSLAKVLKKVLDLSPDQRKKVAEEGYHEVKKYTWDTTTQKNFELYQKLIK